MNGQLPYRAMNRAVLVRTLWIADLVWLIVAMLLATAHIFGVWMPWLARTPTGTLMPSVGLTLVGAIVATYVTYKAGDSTVSRAAYGQAVAIVAPTLMITSIGLLVSREYFSRQWLLITFGLWLAMLIVHRGFLRQRPWAEPMVIVTQETSLAQMIGATPYADVIATVAPDADPAEVPLLADGTLVVDLGAALSKEMASFVSSASVSGQRVRPLVEVYEEHTGRLPLVHLVGGWEIRRPVSRSRYAPVKRMIDVLLVLVAMPLWIPLWCLVWTVVRLTSHGPVIYRQPRVGRGGKEFTLLKFRTMVEDAEHDGPQFTAEDDSRLTSVGRFLRRSRLDEIPQLWNVVLGDLALVGPRPERRVFVDSFADAIPFYNTRHLIRPGITGWAQIQRGYGDSIDDALDKLTFDLYYVKHSSPWLDMEILGRTVWTVLTGDGSR